MLETKQLHFNKVDKKAMLNHTEWSCKFQLNLLISSHFEFIHWKFIFIIILFNK